MPIWTYTADELAKILCATLDVVEMKFDDKKKRLVITIKMPNLEDKIKKMQEKLKNASKEGEENKSYQ